MGTRTLRGLVVVFSCVGLVALSGRELRGELPRATIETTPSLASHLKLESGRVMIRGGGELTVLRNLQVKIVEKADLDLKSDLPESSLPDLLLQIKPGRMQIGHSAFTTLPLSVISGEKTLDGLRKHLPKIIRGYPHVYPYYLQVPLELRLRIRGVSGPAGNVHSNVFSSHGYLKRPDEKAKRAGLALGVARVDGYLRRTLGVQLLQITSGVEDSKATFNVRIKNPHRFPIGGSIRVPSSDDYRIARPSRGFRIEPGDEHVEKIQLQPIDYDGTPKWPAWWSPPKRRRGRRSRYSAFQFPRLEFNVAKNSKSADFISKPPAKKDMAVDLLADVNLRRDTYSIGRWNKKGTDLVYLGGSADPQVRFFVQPPSEYDLSVEFSQQRLGRPLRVIVPTKDSRLVCQVGGPEGLVSLQVRAPFGRHPAERQIAGIVKAKRRHVLILKMRRDRVDVLLDGKRMINHLTDFKDLRSDKRSVPLDRRHPAIITDVPTIFHSVKLTPVYPDST